MSYPTPSDYQEALQLPDVAFADPVLARGHVVTNALGLPRAITGVFAVVFEVETRAGPRAVRAFLRDDPARERRYRTLQHALDATPLDYFVAFEWHSNGVRVGDRTYPLLVMEWADGVPLDRYVETHRADAERLRALFEAWRVMLDELHAADFVHGDLHHGNVFVTERTNPELIGDGGIGGGGTVQPSLVLVDYDAMRVPGMRGPAAPEIGHRNYQHPERSVEAPSPSADRFPGLVVATAIAAVAADPALWDRYATGENLLFGADDFFDPAASLLFAELDLADELHNTDDPDLDALAAALRTACYLDPERVPTLGAVLSGNVPEPRARRRPARRGEWGSKQQRTAFERAFLSTAALAVGLALAAWWVPSLLLVAGLALLLLVGVAGYRWRSRPERRRRQRLARELALLDGWIRDLDEEVRRLRLRQRTVFDNWADHVAERLAELQREALERHLRRHFVNELDALDGVGHRAVVRLKAAGIRDAAMATPEAVRSVRTLSEATKVRIGQWRSALTRRYAEAVPSTLPPSEEQRLRRVLERRRAEADAEIQRIDAKAEAQSAEREAVAQRLEAVLALPFTH